MRALRTGVSGSGRREKLEAPVLRRQRIVHSIPDYAIPLALFLIALAVRLYRLDAQSLWLDEGSSWQMARQSWATLLGDLLSPTAAYPLYHVLLKLWMALFGDSEFALRLPSALAGAVAVPVMYLAAQEAGGRQQAVSDKKHDQRPKNRGWLYPLAAAGIALIGPFPLWYAQEAKAYSLLLLAAALLMWSLLRALRTQAGRDWLIFGAVALVAIFIHRLASLAVLAGGWAWLGASIRQQKREGQGWRWAAAGGLALASAGLVTVMSYGLGSDRAATGAYIPAGPLSALGLTFSRFSLDRWPGDVAWWWLLPWVALLAWGLVYLGVDGLKIGGTASGMGDSRAAPMGLLCMLIVPLGLFVTQLLFTRLYEARYLIVIYPAWVLVLSYPLHKVRGQMAGGLIVLAALASSLAALFQPPLGLFSGAPVKEQYREAISELAARVQPDDAVVIHPSYIRPLYDYYMGRLSTDPAPEPLVFADFWQGET
ncbi:MAG: DUF2723 domain-containing protein, partial [Oscillochloris sp.]|nr:DUF2723 domain-containing protein [Oscillochloris sp.]